MTDPAIRSIQPQPLTTAAFARYGDVVDAPADASWQAINHGHGRRAGDLAQIEVAAQDGYPRFSIFQSTPLPRPITVRWMERHPLGSQLFFPLDRQPYLVVVAPAGELDSAAIEVFVAAPGQGVNYAAGTWHHFSLALNQVSRFLVLDRGGPGDNTEEVELGSGQQVIIDY